MTIEYAGAKQLLAERRRLLAGYDRAREQARSHEVETFHGTVAEALVREWLERFLPKRFGVTSGYIVSQVLSQTPLHHFDVIIYEQLDAPVLWIEDSPDRSKSGSSRAIPVEHVRAVIEVKAALTPKSAKEAIDHLADLLPQLHGEDAPGERYKKFLRRDFVCMAIFFELRKKDAHRPACINNLLPPPELRGYFGATILRGEGIHDDACGEFRLMVGDGLANIHNINGDTLLHGNSFSKPLQCGENRTLVGMLNWAPFLFSRLAFDIVALLSGTYESGRLSSFYGFHAGQPQLPSEDCAVLGA